MKIYLNLILYWYASFHSKCIAVFILRVFNCNVEPYRLKKKKIRGWGGDEGLPAHLGGGSWINTKDGKEYFEILFQDGPCVDFCIIKWTASSEFGTYHLCEQRRFRRGCAVSPEPPLLAHTSSESWGTFRQKARSLASLNGWACAVKTCHDGMLEDTNSLDGAQILEKKNAYMYKCTYTFLRKLVSFQKFDKIAVFRGSKFSLGTRTAITLVH